jgi:glycogen debranching enzyme
LSREERLKVLKWKVDSLKNNYGLLGIIDIVLNHTANNSEWLLKHPESAYNTTDCPHLTSAYVLDRALADFSYDFSKCKYKELPFAPYINNESDLKMVISQI